MFYNYAHALNHPSSAKGLFTFDSVRLCFELGEHLAQLETSTVETLISRDVIDKGCATWHQSSCGYDVITKTSTHAVAWRATGQVHVEARS